MERAVNKAERLRQMETLLLAHPEGLRPAEIARRLGVHRSTVGRDLTDLTRLIPLCEDESGRVGINRDDYLVALRLTLHESMAVHLAARLLAGHTDKHNPHAGAALRKLGLALEGLAPLVSRHLQLSADVMDSAAQRHDPVYLEVLEKLTRAWSDGRQVRLSHQAPDGRIYSYTFSPYYIEPYAAGRTAHAIGWREPPGAVRTFKLERIRRIELLETPYQIPAGFDPRDLLADAWGIWTSEEEPTEVALRFHPRVAGRVRETRWHSSERVEAEGVDGALIWRATIAEPQEMLPWIRGWGAEVEVLEPAGLRDQLVKEARRLARLYQIAPQEDVGQRYYAHSREGADESEWQLLRDHLLATGELAYRLGEDAGVGHLARAAGMLHDIGKYSPAFQDRLRGARRRVDHATAGAREVVQQFPGNLWAELISYCIAGHHSGLPDYGDPTDLPDAPTLLARRDKKRLDGYGGYRAEIDLSTLDLAPVPLKPAPAHAAFTVSFLTRMIYSTLVDADWLETETAMQSRLQPRGGYPSLATLLERLNLYLRRFENAQGPVNVKRAETLRACVAQASREPGFFTLTVPTGGGKTLASMAFALQHAVRHGLKRIIYVIPFTSIIEQNAAVFKEALGEENVLEHHSNFDWEQLRGRWVTNADDETNQLVAKLRLAAENWDIPVVVTTNVQFFESLFAHKKSRARKVHHIAKSVIIFDEAQMLPREHMQPCMLAVWELVRNYGSTAVFCTATQPSLEPFFEGEEMTELAPDPQALFDFYRRVRITPAGELPDEELAAQLNSHRQALCVVNTRRHAKGLFDLLEAEGRHHLSSLMCPAHRQCVLRTIRQRLADGEICRVVSTQVIEAGVDVDFPVGYRAMAGLDSIIQTAGRVNRERRNASGEVVVFLPKTDLVKRTPAYIAQTSRAGAAILRDFAADPTGVEAIQAYFGLLDTLQDPQRNSDVKHMLAYLDKRHFDFARAGEAFRLIDAPTVPVVVPYDDVAQDLLEELRYSQYPAGLARRLQRYTVSIYQRECDALTAKGAIDTYHDLYSVLNDMGYYDPETGLALLTDQGGEAIFFD
jgi:CRISPR-associated endonuclease/helicase Cas3